MNKFKSFFWSYDFSISLAIGIILYIVLPEFLSMKFMLTYYEIIITTISIIFSLMFASCSILMSSSDNDFINFLNEKNDFDNLLWTFRITLFALFISLIYALVIFVATNYIVEMAKEGEVWVQHKIFFTTLSSITIYGLIATFLSVEDTLKFSKFRSRFLKDKKE